MHILPVELIFASIRRQPQQAQVGLRLLRAQVTAGFPSAPSSPAPSLSGFTSQRGIV